MDDVYFYQDGPDFYTFKNDNLEGNPVVVTFPQRVVHSNERIAAVARQWFVTQWCPANNLLPFRV